MKKSLLIISLLGITQPSLAEPLPEITPNKDDLNYQMNCYAVNGEDLCEQNAKIVKEFKSKLPIKINKNISLIDISSVDTELIADEQFNIDQVGYEAMFKTINSTPAEINTALSEMGRNQFCKGSLKTMIEKGTKVTFNFFFKDMSPYMSLTIDNCAANPR